MLRVWLPMTKDLRNQGLDDVTVTNHGATFNSAGKLGGCYYFNGDKQWLQFGSVLGEYYNNDWSIACWLKPTDSTRSVIISEYNTSGASNVGLELTTSRVVRLYWNGSPDINFTTAGALPLNEWTHLVVTKAGRVVKVYFNGELKQTYTNSSDFSTRTSAAQPRIGDDYRGNSANTVSYQGYINDFRMYDHCLSEMEVKQLSQGLVLHYPLNRQGFGQENLLKNTNDLTKWNKESGISVEWDETELMYKIFTTTRESSRWGIYQDYAITVDTDTDYTFSLTGKTDGFSAYLSFGAGMSWPSNYIAFTTTKQRLSKTLTIPAGTTNIRVYLAVYPKTGGGHMYFEKPKLEKGSIATPWCPNSSDTLATTMNLNSTTEYDCSGFCNNGTRTGTFTWTSDTPKYNVSTVFPSGSNFITAGRGAMVTDSITVSLWCKYSTWGNPISCTEGGGWNFENGSNSIRFPVYVSGVGYKIAESNIAPSTLINQWHMITGTFDKTNIKIYIDGELKGTIATGSTNGIAYPSSNAIFIGAESAGSATSPESSYFVGNISDVRIYATALSASDVKSLYQNSAYIDSSGNVYGAVHSEV